MSQCFLCYRGLLTGSAVADVTRVVEVQVCLVIELQGDMSRVSTTTVMLLCMKACCLSNQSRSRHLTDRVREEPRFSTHS